MSKKLTDDQSKVDLVARLVKDGAIDFADAIKLLEVEVEKEYISYPVRDAWWGILPPYFPTTCGDTVTFELSTSNNNGTVTDLKVNPTTSVVNSDRIGGFLSYTN
jgi:hypothetical protein